MDIDVALLKILCVLFLILNVSFIIFIYFLSRKLGYWDLKLPLSLWDTVNVEMLSAKEKSDHIDLAKLDDNSHCRGTSGSIIAEATVDIPTLFALKKVQATKLKLSGGNRITRLSTIMIFDKTGSDVGIKIHQFRSFSYATRKGLPQKVTIIYVVIELCFVWVFLLQLPLSTLPAVSLAVGTPATILVPIVDISYRMHFPLAMVAFVGMSGSIYFTVVELWNWNGNINIFLAISASLLTICLIITPKFYIFEWAAIYVVSSWYQITWILMQTQVR